MTKKDSLRLKSPGRFPLTGFSRARFPLTVCFYEGIRVQKRRTYVLACSQMSSMGFCVGQSYQF